MSWWLQGSEAGRVASCFPSARCQDEYRLILTFVRILGAWGERSTQGNAHLPFRRPQNSITCSCTCAHAEEWEDVHPLRPLSPTFLKRKKKSSQTEIHISYPPSHSHIILQSGIWLCGLSETFASWDPLTSTGRTSQLTETKYQRAI